MNDPIMLRPYEDEFWFSLSDSDIALFLQGINYDGRYDVDIREIDVEEKNKIDEQNDLNRFQNLFFQSKIIQNRLEMFLLPKS